MFIMSHPSGNMNVRAVLLALQGQEMLSDFITTIGVGLSENHLLPLLPPSIRREVSRRSYPVPGARLTRSPLRELTRILASRCLHIPIAASLVKHESGWAAMDAVNRDVDQTTAHLVNVRKGLSGVYCYEDCAEATFQAAHKRDLVCVYDLPIAYSDTSDLLLREEAERWPEWEPTLGGTRDSAEKRERKRREMEAADVVIVPSDFVLRSLPKSIRDAKACHVIPFGSPNTTLSSSTSQEQSLRTESDEGCLRVLFAGTMTQRKGLADLFAAMQLLGKRPDIELICMGPLAAPIDFYKKQYGDFCYEPTRPHAEVLQLMQSCDVFVLPSIVEGRALVQQEAMACGLPLLITANTGGEDLVLPGQTGFVIPIRDPEAIAEKLLWFAHHRKTHLPAMRESARLHATKYTWERYGNDVISACRGTRLWDHDRLEESEHASLT